jgi:hypothetical protein
VPHPEVLAWRGSIDCNAHVAVQQTGQEEQEVVVPGERIVYEQHARTAGQARFQRDHFPGEPARRRLYTFEDAQRLQTFLPVAGREEQNKQDG